MPGQVEKKKRAHRRMRRGNSLWHDAFRYLFRQRSAILGMIILGGMVLTATFAPVIASHDPELSMLDVPEEVALGIRRRLPPCIHLLGCPEEQPQHILGLDSNVRDLFSRVIFGARYSLYIGFNIPVRSSNIDSYNTNFLYDSYTRWCSNNRYRHCSHSVSTRPLFNGYIVAMVL